MKSGSCYFSLKSILHRMVKSLSYGEVEEKAEVALRALLGEVPFLKTRIERLTADDGSQIDLVADLQVSGTAITGNWSLPEAAREWFKVMPI